MDTSLLSLPDAALLEVLRHLDARSLVALESTNSYFSRREPCNRLPLVEAVAKEAVLRMCGPEHAKRFRHRTWRERLHLEEATGVAFDRTFSEEGGFSFQFTEGGTALQSVQLTGMGPKLLVSDLSTAQQGTIRWQLRVKGNTAVEFGVIPAELQPSHTSLHKCMAVTGCPEHRAMGFCSQITAGSLLPLKAPVMRGTVLDVVARRGRLEVVLVYPPDAREISWENGQPVQRPYRGPAQLRFEQDFPPTYDVRLAVTSWAKAQFEVLHAPATPLDPEWAMSAAAMAGEEGAAAEADAGAAAAAAAAPLPEAFLMAAAEVVVDDADDAALPLLHPAAMLNAEQQQQAAAAAAAQQDDQLLVDAILQAEQLQQMVAGAVAAAAQDAAAAAANAPHTAAPEQPSAATPQELEELLDRPGAGAEVAGLPNAGPTAAGQPRDSADTGLPPETAAVPEPGSSLCPSPSGELFLDGHVQSPSN